MYDYELEIVKYKDKLINIFEKHRNIIIKGPTGCGKSTYVPLLLKDKNVAIIEPRRIAVTSLYAILKKNIPNIGYKMRFNKVNPKQDGPKTMIFTDGAFLADMDMDYDYIIIDEVHERSVRNDILLMLLKLNYKNKLIMMSATLDTTKLCSYFKAFVFNIRTKTFPLCLKYLSKPTNDYIIESYLTVKKIIKETDDDSRKDILIFLPGVDCINDLAKLIKKIPTVKVYKIYSAMADIDQSKIFENCLMRKVILSTNISETSLTIPTVKYVIDTGLVKTKIFKGINFLGIQATSIESSRQRAGRCNRLGSGTCYRLYTENEKLPEAVPEIIKSDVSTAVLLLLKNNINLKTAKFIDLPTKENLIIAIDFLQKIECIYIKDDTAVITKYGSRLINHPFDIHLSHFYELCVEAGEAYYGSILVSLIGLDNYNFLQNKNSKEMKTKETDIEYLVGIFEKYIEHKNKEEFCLEKGLSIKGMSVAYKIYKTLKKTKTENGLQVVQKIFSKAFALNLCLRQKDGSYKLLNTEQIVNLHPSSGFFKRNIQKIVVVDFFYTSKLYCRIVGNYFE
ncbi:Dhx33 [Nucleospora cyclopteri]